MWVAIPAIITALTPFFILLWISSNPRSVEEIGKELGGAFGQAAKGAGEGVITPILEYVLLGSGIALAIAVAYRAVERGTGFQLPEPPAPPGFAPAPTPSVTFGVQGGPLRGGIGVGSAPTVPGQPAPARPIVFRRSADRRR